MVAGERPANGREAELRRIGGRYGVEATLGSGGMGAVYRVRDAASGRQVALKQMSAAGGEGREAAELRFRREFHTMASLRHPRIVEVYDYGVDGAAPYYTMEMLDGQDLADLESVPVKRACELLHDVATALGFLHARRLLHRDLAPRNVRCTGDGRAKLIDFGVLATTGICDDVAGTPPFMAPEALLGRPLDHRYDLYGLGALAYRILTGKHAFPARAIEELEAAWRNRPAPPSQLAPDIPPALDELVLALLAHDQLARPANAAEVIDRLSVIGGLDRPTEVETTHGWIASAALVGRQREMASIKRAVTRTHERAGSSLLIEAPSGTGKTRLLRELGLEAQLAGLCVVRADSDVAGRGPYGIFHELARGLIAALPEALTAARARGPMLARVITSLRDAGIRPARPLGDPAEDRMRLQGELVAWVLDVAASHPIALVVDDIQRCDEASAAVLAVLGHQAADRKLLVAVALRTDETVRAPAPIASLCDSGQRLRLRGLGERELEELCRSLFGDVPHVPRLARWMHEVAGGSPLHTTELARHLVDRGVIRYVDGLWSIPEEPGREDLPHGLADAMDARVHALSAPARALAEAMSVHRGDMPLRLIVQLADTRDDGAVFTALDQLAYEEVLIQAGESWRFRHDGLREAVLRGVDDDRRRELHRRVGRALAAFTSTGEGASAERDAEIGWHLLQGGDPDQGAPRLERAGRALYDAQSFADCIAPLEAALGVLETKRGSARVRLELLHMLLMAGCMADRATALRHSEPCVQGFCYWSGVDVATRAGKLVGRHLGVMIGLLWALLRWIFTPRRGPNPYEAFRTVFVVVGYTASIYGMGFDLDKVQELIDLLAPVAIGKQRVPYAAYLLTRNIHAFPAGELALCERNSRRILEILAADRITPIRPIDRRTGEGAARLILVLRASLQLDPTLDDELAGMLGLQLRFFDVAAEQARIIWHRLRGEEEEATAIEARVELMLVQLGSIWQLQSFVHVLYTVAYGLTRDTLGLRRNIEQLYARCVEGLQYRRFLAVARGEYLRERGDLAASLTELEPLTRDRDALVLTIALPACAETLLATGEPARAREIAARGLALASAPETYTLHAKMRCARTMALADAALGAHAAAAQKLDQALAEAAPYASPLLSGVLHEARARVALVAEDAQMFYLHLADTDRLFRQTRNPALVARADRLAEAGIRQSASTSAAGHGDATPTEAMAPGGPRLLRAADVGSVVTEAVTTPPPSEVRNWVATVMAGCRGSAERATRALQLIITEARGVSGYLYLRRPGGLELAAPTWGTEPARELTLALAAALERDGSTIADLPRPGGHAGKLDWRPVPLVLAVGGEPARVVGGAAVLAGAMPLVDPNPRLLAELARELFDAGDVTVLPAKAR